MGTNLMSRNGREGWSESSLVDKEKVAREETAEKNAGAGHLQECRTMKHFSKV